jgi:hypothetical protein
MRTDDDPLFRFVWRTIQFCEKWFEALDRFGNEECSLDLQVFGPIGVTFEERRVRSRFRFLRREPRVLDLGANQGGDHQADGELSEGSEFVDRPGVHRGYPV